MSKHAAGGEKRTIKLVLEYDGSAFHGWQTQKSDRSVQSTVAEAIRKVTGERVKLVGAGRTDAGVHAEGQVAHFATSSAIPAERLVHAINSELPASVAATSAEVVPADFHARFGAVSKEYRYTVLVRATRSPLWEGRAHRVRGPLDVAAMRRATAHLVGERDFRSFGTEMTGKDRTVRRLDSLDIAEEDDRVVFRFVGGGFLYNMVRTIVGTLLWVGRGKLGPDDVKRILEARDRRKAGPNAPAGGLCLVRVNYE